MRNICEQRSGFRGGAFRDWRLIALLIALLVVALASLLIDPVSRLLTVT